MPFDSREATWSTILSSRRSYFLFEVPVVITRSPELYCQNRQHL